MFSSERTDVWSSAYITCLLRKGVKICWNSCCVWFSISKSCSNVSSSDESGESGMSGGRDSSLVSKSSCVAFLEIKPLAISMLFIDGICDSS